MKITKRAGLSCLIIFLLLAALPFSSRSQNKKHPEIAALEDSLLRINLYNTEVRDKVYQQLISLCKKYDDHESLINYLTELGKVYIGITLDTEKAYRYISEAEKKAAVLGYTPGLAKALLFKAYYYHIVNDRATSIDYILRAKREFSKIDHLDDLIIKKETLYSLTGDIYKVFNMFDSSLYNYNVALEEAHRVNDYSMQLQMELRIADLIESVQGDYYTTGKIYERILTDDRAASKFRSISARKLADIMVMQNERDSAKNLLRLSYRINRQNGSALTFIAADLARIFASENQPDSAMYYLRKADEIPHTDIGALQMDLGYSYAYLAKEDHELALYYNEKALEKIANKPESGLVTEALNQKRKIELRKKDYESAYRTLEQLMQWEDSVMAYDRQKDLFALQSKYENDAAIKDLMRKNEIEQLELKQRNLRLLVVIIVLVSLLLIGYLIYNRQRIRQDQQNNELNQKLLRLQLNPHFIFNALASIQSFIMTNNNRAASISLARFGELTRDILETSDETFIPLEKESAMLHNYVEVQRTRFEEEVVFELNIDESIDRSMVMIPPMFIQPFIENAFEHGLNRKKGGKIVVEIRKLQNSLQVLIADNGVGMLKEKTDQQHQSMAISVIRKRLARMNPKGKKSGGLKIRNRMAEGVVIGLTIEFELPLITR